MRLYLSSWRIGDRAGSLLAMLGSPARAAIILNGYDGRDGHDGQATLQRDRQAMVAYDPAAELSSLGIAAECLDLRQYFGRAEALRRSLETFDLVWVAGGNAFVLRHAMQASGFDDVLVELLDEDRLVYGGCGAGAAIAAPHLEGLQFMHDRDRLPEGYPPPSQTWDGLGLIDHALVPHYRSPHPDSRAAEAMVRHLNARGLRHRPLRDGEVMLWTETRHHAITSRRSA